MDASFFYCFSFDYFERESNIFFECNGARQSRRDGPFDMPMVTFRVVPTPVGCFDLFVFVFDYLDSSSMTLTDDCRLAKWTCHDTSSDRDDWLIVLF